MRSLDTHTFFAHTLKVCYKSAYHLSMLRMCERVNISLVRADWKRIWEHQCSRRERALAGTRDWTAIGQSFDTVGKMLGCCPIAWIQRVCYLMGTTYSPCSVFRRGPCVYILFPMELGAIYIGCVGAIQYYHRHRKHKWKTYGVGHHSRQAFDHAKEHLGKRLWALKKLSRGKYKRWSMAQMYALMASIGAHRWVLVPVEMAMPADCMRKETKWLGALPRNVNTAPPPRSPLKYLQILKGGLAPAAHFPTEFTSMVRWEVYGKRSTLGAKEALSLMVVSEPGLGVRLWRQLFDHVCARLRRECTHQNVSLFKEMPVCLPGSCDQLCGPFVDMTRSVIRQSPAPRWLKQYYMNRVMIKPRHSASVGHLLHSPRFTYTPATLQQDLNAACPCAKHPAICQPAPLNHIVIRPTDPDRGNLYRDVLHRPTLAQCMMNATLPSPSTFFICVHDPFRILSRALPQLGPKLWLAMKHAFWEQGKSIYRGLEASADPRIHPETVRDVRNAHPWLSWGPLDKNAAVLVAHCGVLRPRFFTEHFNDSPRYTALQSYADPTLAQSYVLCHIAESAFEQGCGAYVPRNWSRRCVTYCMSYIKHESTEATGYFKVCPIISHAVHPLQNLGTRMSRALSLSVQQLASMPGNSEAFTMPDVLQHFRNVDEAMQQQSHDTADWKLGELDLEDMLLNIDKGLLLESYDYMIERLDQFVPPAQGRYLSRSRFVHFVSISTIDKQFDCLHRAPGMDVYHYIPVNCLRNFVHFKVRFNNLLCAGRYVLSQHRDVPMGGKLSSQLSLLFLMCKEMHSTHISLFGTAVFHTRYKDNI